MSLVRSQPIQPNKGEKGEQMSETDKIKDFLLKNYPDQCKKHKDKSFADLTIEVLMYQKRENK